MEFFVRKRESGKTNVVWSCPLQTASQIFLLAVLGRNFLTGVALASSPSNEQTSAWAPPPLHLPWHSRAAACLAVTAVMQSLVQSCGLGLAELQEVVGQLTH